jgi:superfamily II DNA or RNA helicase
MIQKYDGAILADAVGLGKTWSALAVMKYYELQGYKVVVICPRKLSNNWTRYKKDNHSVFEADKLEFYTLPQSQLFENGASIESMPISNFKKFQKLFIVIDESHNLRNDGVNRYKFLISQFYSNLGNKDIKTLLLSATPINNKLIDVRNQFKIIAKGNDSGFAKTPGIEIKSLEDKFTTAQKYFNKWQFQTDRKMSDLRAVIPDEITTLIDSMVVARTRQLIKKYLNEDIHFPKVAPPEPIPGNVIEMGAIKTIDDVLSAIERVNMTAYKPAFYMKVVKAKDATEDDRSRQKGLARLMYILLVKRMESSWFSFNQTVNSIYIYHLTVLKLVSVYRNDKSQGAPEIPSEDPEQMEIDEILEDMNIEGEEIGKKRVIHLSEIIQLDKFEEDLRKDVGNLKFLIDNLEVLSTKIKAEDVIKKPKISADIKLEQLIKVITKKRKENPKRKIIIFSVFRDTSKYLYDQLKSRGYENLGLVTGSENQCTHKNIKKKNESDFEPILERFAPETKLYREKDWDFLYETQKIEKPKNYKEWLAIIKKFDKETQIILDQPIDLLIATDCLSEGQNLQDADCLINYDIHWNPVRLIQRFGRIDRIGSKFKTIYGINFWPAKDVDDYLRLKSRVESRMAAGSLIGTETQTISKNFDDILDDKDKIISKQAEKLFKQLEASWEDIEGQAESVGFNDLSYEQFRQELFELMGSKKEELERIPNGVYTGFNSNPETKLHAFGAGIMGLIGYPRKPENSSDHQYTHLELFYISKDKKFQILNNMEVLHNLRENKKENRFVPDNVDQPSVATIEELKGLIEEWMKRKFAQEDYDALTKMADGGKVDKINKDEIPVERYTVENYDLITWFVVSKNKNF